MKKYGFIYDKLAKMYHKLTYNLHPDKDTLSKSVKLRSKREKSGKNKITLKDAQEIRKLYFTGFYTQWALANAYGINQSTIQKILVGKTWKEHK